MSIESARTASTSTGRRGLLVRQVPGDTEEDRGVGDPVAHRVEERAAGPGPAAGAGDRAVEDVGQAGEDHAEHAEQQVPVGDRERGGDREAEPDDGEAVGGDARRGAGPGRRARALARPLRASVRRAWNSPRDRSGTGGDTRSSDSGYQHPRPAPGRPGTGAGSGRDLRRLRANEHPIDRGGGGAGQDVPDGQDPQRRPGGPRRRGQDVAGRGAALRRRAPISRLGRVEDGNTVTDFDPEEARRRISVSLAHRPVRARGQQGQRARHAGLRRLHRRRRRRAARRRPRDLRGVGGRGRRGADRGGVADGRASSGSRGRSSSTSSTASGRRSTRTLDAAQGRSSARAWRRCSSRSARKPTSTACRAARRHRGPLRRRRQRHRRAGPIPPEMETRSTRVHDALVEGIVVADDDLMERYLADETIAVERARERARVGRRVGLGVPGAVRQRDEAASASTGSRTSSPREGPPPRGRPTGPPVAFVFKTIVDPYVGRVNLFKVLQGTVKTDATLVNGRTVAEERLHQLTVMRGKEQEPVGRGAAPATSPRSPSSPTPPPATCSARAAPTIEVRAVRTRPSRCSPPRSAPSRRATRTSSPTRCTACSTRTPRCGSSATPRPTRRCCGAWARRTSGSRSSACTASSASRSRPTT